MEKYMDDPDMQKVKDVSEDAARSTKKNWHFYYFYICNLFKNIKSFFKEIKNHFWPIRIYAYESMLKFTRQK